MAIVFWPLPGNKTGGLTCVCIDDATQETSERFNEHATTVQLLEKEFQCLAQAYRFISKLKFYNDQGMAVQFHSVIRQKFTLEKATKAQRGSIGTALLFL